MIRTGRTELYPELPVELIESSAQDAEHLTIIRELALSSALVVPLTVDDEVLGALTMIHAESGRHYVPDDVTFAEDVARRPRSPCVPPPPSGRRRPTRRRAAGRGRGTAGDPRAPARAAGACGSGRP